MKTTVGYGLMVLMGVTGPALAESVQVQLLRSNAENFSGDTTLKDFYFQLPAHVNFAPGSELNLALGGDPLLISLVSRVDLLVNGRRVSSQSLDGKNPADTHRNPLRITANIPPRHFQAGWNRVGLRFLFRDTAKVNQDFLTRTEWTVTRAGSYAVVHYERAELFPEVRRFPESLAEEKLLHPLPTNKPTLALLLPARPRHAHLRGCAIIAARLGQLAYLSDTDCRLGKVDNWNSELPASNGILLACRDELDSASLPDSIAAELRQLKTGEGFLAEFITGSRSQRRWLLVSGADDAGLEKAILTLGHAPALAGAPPNPAAIAQMPEIGPELEPVDISLASKNRKSFWPLRVLLQAFDWSGLIPKANARDSNASSSSNHNAIPVNETPGVNHATLAQLPHMLLSDKFLRKTAFLVPRSASPENLKLLFDTALHLGRQLPDSRVLWPEACDFSRGSAPPLERLQNRSVLLLGPVVDWKYALPRTSHFSLEVTAPESGLGRMQGRSHKLGDFEPSLAFMNLLRSPWSPADSLVAVGGWLDTPTTPIKTLLREAAPAGFLRGNLCAMDASHRFAAYDTREPMLKSFAELLHRHIPLGLNPDETAARLEQHERHLYTSGRINRIIAYVAGGVLLFLVFGRLLLVWAREWDRRRVLRHEKPLGSTS